MRHYDDIAAIEALRAFAEFHGEKKFVFLCSEALRGSKEATTLIEDALLDFCFATRDESRVLEIMKSAKYPWPDGTCPRCRRSDGSHVGYHEDVELPIKRGDRVRVKAGAEIWTTLPDPAKKRFTLTRARVVTVHDMDCGQTILSSLYGDEKHKHRILELDWAIPKEDDANQRDLMRMERSDLERGLLHTADPGVCWVGTGGYWHHARLVDVELVTAKDAT